MDVGIFAETSETEESEQGVTEAEAREQAGIVEEGSDDNWDTEYDNGYSWPKWS